MSYSFLVCCIITIQITTTACSLGWKQTEGAQVLPEAYPGQVSPTDDVDGPASRRVAIVLPDGWHWVMRGQDLMATRDGVFLQNIFIERIHVDQVEQSISGMFPLAALSSKQWPLRTVKYLKKRFAAGMPPTEGADVIVGSRANDPSVTDLVVREVVAQQFAGNHGFRAVFDFRLNAPVDLRVLGGGGKSEYDVRGRRTPYRSVYCGFMLGKWFYGISYTAALRYYFQKDVEAFESVLQSFHLIER